MSTPLQQQVFALDAKYNASRGQNIPNFRTLYIRRRNQLLRETDREPEKWKQYLKVRSLLLQQRYGVPKVANDAYENLTRSASRASDLKLPSITGEFPSRPKYDTLKITSNRNSENMTFNGVHHIFDQHTAAVTSIKFANNDRYKLSCSSVDCTLSLCDVSTTPSTVISVLREHSKPVTCLDWSANNDLIASTSLDGTIKVWNTETYTCLRTIEEPNNAQLLSCLFQPLNNNLLVVGNSQGLVLIANVSTGRFMKSVCRIGGNVLSLASDTNGRMYWAGNDKGEIVSMICDASGCLNRTRRLTLNVPCSVTSLSFRLSVKKDVKDPTLLVNFTDNAVCLFSIVNNRGAIRLRRKFENRHQKHLVKSIFCPNSSTAHNAYIVTGSEDGSIYFLDVEKPESKVCVNTLQGHACTVLGVSFNCDETLLATSDLEGLIIIWKKAVKST